MSWFFEGNGQQIGFAVSENGVLSAHGRCSQNCDTDRVLMAIVPRMNDVAAEWRIYTPASEEGEYELFDGGLKNFFAENGEKAVGRIYFFPASEDKGEQASILLSVLAPNDFAASAFTLLKAAMGSPSFRFVITAEFVGFSPEDVPTNRIPKISEFTHPELLKRRGYFSRQICLSVRTFV